MMEDSRKPLLFVVALALLVLFQWIALITFNDSPLEGKEKSGVHGLHQPLGENWQIQHPGCADLKNITVFSDGHFVRSAYPPRYDHMSCFVMKSRYNCAGQKVENAATNWKLVLRQNKQTCDLRAVIDDTHGPMGVAQEMRRQRGLPDSRPVNVVLQGNSFLRQIWEAFVCGWRHDITQIQVHQGGPHVSLEAMKNMGNGKFNASQFGKPINMRDLFGGHPETTNFSAIQGCHAGPKNQSSYYVPGKPVPRNLDECNDNMAMVEFGGMIRFHYIFRSNRLYENMTDVYKHLGLQVENIDALMFNDGEESTFQQKSSLRRGVFERSPIWVGNFVQYTLMRLQLRDIGVWKGATNPRMVESPDAHPCMPGVPDDEANLLLFSLLSDAKVSMA